MKLVIDIDEDVFTRLFDNGGDDESDIAKVCAAVRGGEILLERHGNNAPQEFQDIVGIVTIPSNYYLVGEIEDKIIYREPLSGKEICINKDQLYTFGDPEF